MATIHVAIPAKPALDPRDLQRCQDFESALQQAMVMAAHANATRLSQIEPKYIGVETSPKTAPSTIGAVQSFHQSSGHNYATNQAHDFLSSRPKMPFARAHYGYPIEAETEVKLQQNFSGRFKRAFGQSLTPGDYLYNEPERYATLGFPIDFYHGGSSGARPDWRLKLLHSDGEAVFDATSEAQRDHLKKKKVGSLTLDKIPKVLYGAEIIYETSDAYFSASTPSCKVYLYALAVAALGVTALALSTYLSYVNQAEDKK